MSTTPHQGSAKYAVIRLKRSDDVLELFQLLIRNGFAEVSFVNALNETIFPTQNKIDKATQTIIQQETHHQHSAELTFYHQQPVISVNQIIQSSTTKPADTATTTIGDIKSNDPIDITSCSDERLLRLNLVRCGTMATLPTIPSTYLGLPTLPSLLPTAGHQQAHSSRSLFHDILPVGDATPPYSLSGHGLFPSPIPSVISTQISLPLQNRPMSTSAGVVSVAGSTQSLHRKEVFGTSPPVTTSEIVLFNSTLLPGLTTTQLRQRGQRACTADDPSMYVVCRMCKNKIMGSRISNLTNHVRRHSTLKQFQCCYCDYTHNEMAKVRLHMLHNHKDKDSQPIDNVSPEMQIAWDILMKECFPEQCHSNSNPATNVGGRTRRSWKQSGPSSDRSSESGSFSGTAMELGSPVEPTANVDKQPDEMKMTKNIYGDAGVRQCEVVRVENYANFKPSLESSVRCVECGQTVNVQRRLHHIQKYHLRCMPFACSLCTYGAVDQCKVTVHIAVKHKDDPAGHVISRNIESMVEYLLPTYFTSGSYDPNAGPRRRSDYISLSPSESPSEVEVRTPVPPDGLPIKKIKREFSAGRDTERSTIDVDEALTINSKKRSERKTFTCHLCLKNVAGIQSVIRHSIRHAKIKWYKCVTCQYTSCNYKRVCMHLISRHNKIEVTPRLSMIWNVKRPWKSFVQQCFFNPLRVKPTTKLNERNSIKNKHCLGQFGEGKSLKTVKVNQTSTSKRCNLCGSNVSLENMIQHVRFHVPYSVYGCSICAFLTSNRVHARVHLWKHKINVKSRKNAKLLNSTAYAKAHFELCFG